jgi:trehalose 6-phosphate phosphatase
MNVLQSTGVPEKSSGLPNPDANWALFLDLDGTLLDIAEAPDLVRVPDGLADSLRAAADALGGAVAIVSGRRLADLERLLPGVAIPFVAEHGAVVRGPDGTVEAFGAAPPPRAWVDAAMRLAQNAPGVLVEVKSHCIAIHFRRAPGHARAVAQLGRRLTANRRRDFQVVEARCAIEVRPVGADKGAAVDRILRAPPFTGRTPVFVGDDVTDEDGIRAAVSAGGVGLRVGQNFRGSPQAVRDWLKDLPDRLAGRAGE